MAATLDMLGASQIAAAVAAGEFSAVEVARAALDAIGRRDGDVLSLIHI